MTEIIDNFSLLETWEDRYSYMIDLGRKLAPLTEEERSHDHKVAGCVSQVWLVVDTKKNSHDAPRLFFRGDSDSHLVRGLIAILIALYSGHTAEEIHGENAKTTFGKLHLDEHLTPQRSNGFFSMVERICHEASLLKK